MGELGNCRVCGKDAGVTYPLLPGSPAFCSEHHNSRDAGPFGCDFSGPDDFDIPFNDEDVPFRPSLLPQELNRYTFVWIDKGGVRHLLKDVDDYYLQNIISYLERGEGYATGGDTKRRRDVVDFLRGEALHRGIDMDMRGEW